MEDYDYLNKIKEAFAHSDKLFGEIIESLPYAIFYINPDGEINRFNSNAGKLWGWNSKAGSNTNIHLVSAALTPIYGAGTDSVKKVMGEALSYQKKRIGEKVFLKKPNGSKIPMLLDIDLLYNAEGSFSGTINVVKEIIEGSRLVEDANWLAAIVESSDDAIVSKNLNGIIMSWNKGAEKIFGYTADEVVGKPINILIPADRQEEEVLILSKIRKGERIEHFETIRVTKSGQFINISLTVSPIKNSRNEVVGASKIARDITRQIEITKTLKSYNQKLKEINRVKDDFLSMASHELKTPLTVIKAYLELLQYEDMKEEASTAVNKALKQANKLNGLITSLLDVSNIRKRNLAVQYTDFDLNALVISCIDSVALTEPGFNFERVGPQAPVWVKADEHRLEQVIFNLLSNAIKYSGSGRNIQVQVVAEEHNAVVSVKDFGIGIPASHLNNVFNRFFKLPGQKYDTPGLGLGLFISREIIKRHQGSIWVESEEGKGSTFYFKIPVV